MTTCPPISNFHKWLTADTERNTAGCSILIHDRQAPADEELVRRIAAYLNEYDEEGEGCWLAATDDLVERISSDSFLRQLVGLEYDIPTGSSAYTRTLSALAARGHVVARQPDAGSVDDICPKRFDVGLGDMRATQCHMVLNPEKIGPEHLAPIIGDVFLEWLHCESVRSKPIAGLDINPCLTNESIRKEA